MLKKIIIALMIIAVLCGIGYLGYVVFMAKNIQKVELVGSMQTVYFVGDDIDYENAQLKITYKNGDMKLIDLNKANITTTLFSTSLGSHGKMKITYKNFTIEQEYDVFEKGCYYISSEEVTDALGKTTSTDYISASASKTMIYFYNNGEIRYYQQNNNNWFMNDGKYDKTYNYKITGNTISVSLGKNKAIELKANYNENGTAYLTSIEKEMNSIAPDVPKKVTKSNFKYYEAMKGNLVINKNETGIDYKMSGITDKNYVTFNVGEKINTHANKIYLKVVYTGDIFFNDHTVYVEICDEMNTDVINKLNTSRSIDGFTLTRIYYGDKTEGNNGYDLFYSVAD